MRVLRAPNGSKLRSTKAEHALPASPLRRRSVVHAPRAHLDTKCQHQPYHHKQWRGIARATAAQPVAKTTGKEPTPEERVQVDSEDVYDLAPNVQVVRGTCSCKLRMEVEYMLKHGTSDNCYLVKVPGAVALVDVPYEAYADKFVAALSGSVRLDSLTHIVVTHLDPKSIPTLELLMNTLDKAGGAKINLVLSNPALRLLQQTIGDKPEKADLLAKVTFTTARSGQRIPLGSDPANVLQLELTPTPRWPDLMVAYYPPSRVLFSSKLFSSHVSPPEGVVEDVGGWERYADDWRYFFDCMLAPSARQTLSALDKLDMMPVPMAGGTGMAKAVKRLIAPLREEFAWLRVMLTGRSTPTASAPLAKALDAAPQQAALEVSTVAPMHGPAVRLALAQLLREYRGWANQQIKAADEASVAVLYASAYGNTAALAQAISRGVIKSGVGVNTLNLEVATLEEVTQAVKESDGFILGSPTLGGHLPTQVSVALGAIMRETKAKGMPCGVFGSFGWSGEAVDIMEGRLKDAGFGFSFPAIRVKFKPTNKDLLQCEDSGRDLAIAVKKRSRAREAAQSPGVRAQAVASGAQLAAGRIVGSLCVLTAKDEDATSAMLASWVSQASFDPPGITVAVKKDRSMEPRLQVGGEFAVSIVPEGKDRTVMRRLSRPFAPNEDRLAGLELTEAPLTGAALLKDANAYMECKVVSRMDAGDHYIVYATVIGGEVVNENAQTAVHHRKVANHY